MALPRTEKQSYERYVVGCNYEKALGDAEVIVLAASLIEARDKDGNDMSTVVIEQATVIVDGTRLKFRIREGIEAKSPYKITSKAETDLGNRFELDFEMRVKEL